MNRLDFANLNRGATCRVLGGEYASNDAQRAVIAALMRDLDDPDATLLCEPSLARKSTRPPDVVLVDLLAGLHVIEVKGVSLDQVEALEPGRQFCNRYNESTAGKNPFAQVRNCMFDIKDAVERSHPADLVLPFKYWVEAARLPSFHGIHMATTKKDDLLHQRGWLSVSTVASATFTANEQIRARVTKERIIAVSTLDYVCARVTK